jgi:hypothetical protein
MLAHPFRQQSRIDPKQATRTAPDFELTNCVHLLRQLNIGFLLRFEKMSVVFDLHDWGLATKVAH